MAAALLTLLSAAALAVAADLGGTVLSAAGEAVPGASVRLIDLRRETTTDDEGRFSFADLPPAQVLLEVTSLQHGSAVLQVEVGDGTRSLVVTLDQRVHTGSVSVTATGRPRGLDEVVAPVDVLTDEELALRLESTLGDTLASQPGVSSTGYGRGAGRPVIRGLTADRVRVLENGLDSGDVSSIGPDHGTSVEPMAAEQVEVVRGPATLLYGGTAVGGVVNVIDGRVPDRVPARAATGMVHLAAGSNADERAGSAVVDGGGGSVAWHVEVFARHADSYRSPARRAADGEGHHGGQEDPETTGDEVENTFTESRGGALGLSWVGSRGYIGLSSSLYRSDYGVPGHVHHHEDHVLGPAVGSHILHGDEDDEAAVTIDLEQRRLDLHARLERPWRGVQALQLRAGWRDYAHQEMEGHELGTRFDNEFVEVRLEALLVPLAGFEGVAGVHWLDRDFSAWGEEAFVPPTTTRRVAAFVFEERPADPWGVQLGLRGESQDIATADPGLGTRSFSPVSASAGLSYAFSQVVALNVTASHSERAPTAEELYSNGPHAATRTFEIGDAGLGIEQGNGVDLTVRASGERVSGSASFFLTAFEDYIYPAETGDVEHGLDVRVFTAAEARFRGFELHGDFELYHGGEHHLHLEATYDRVVGELSALDQNIPRIPPQRCRLGLVYLGGRWNARVEGRWVDEQARVAAFEEPTPGHTLLGAAFGYHVMAGGVAHHILLRGTNLTDEAACNHVSHIKFEAPLPGRTVTLSYRAIF